MPVSIITTQQTSPPKSPVTDQMKAIVKVNNVMRNGRIQSFTFVKGSLGEVLKLDKSKAIAPGAISDTIKIVGKTSYNYSDSKHEFYLEIEEKDSTIQSSFENSLFTVNVALALVSKDKKTSQIVTRGTFMKMPGGQYGARFTLPLKDEGEYKILIGALAKPPQSTP